MCSEILGDERKETAAGFLTRSAIFFATIGVAVTGVMTDNGACYRSHAFDHRFTDLAGKVDVDVWHRGKLFIQEAPDVEVMRQRVDW